MKVKVRVTQDNTDAVVRDLRASAARGLEAAVPHIVNAADRNVRGYSDRIADSIRATQIGPLAWLIIAGHHASHIAERGAAHSPARPFLLPALMESRQRVARAVEQASRG